MATADELATRVSNGARWLGEHDPKGVFFLWYEAGIPTNSPLPALKDPVHHGYIEGRAENYREWCKQYRLWLSLNEALDVASKREGYE